MVTKASTLGPGQLTLGAAGDKKQIAQQCTKVAIKFSTSTDDDVPMLDGSTLDGNDTNTATLDFTIQQDYTADSFEEWCFEHKGEKVPFAFTPNIADARMWSGIVKVRPIDIGGDVKKRNTSDGSFPIVGDPTIGAHAA